MRAKAPAGRPASDVIVEAADLLKIIANPNRLAILCRLSEGEASVGEMEEKLGIRQPTLSQQLGELRKTGLVDDRREAKIVFYKLTDARAHALVGYVHALFCTPQTVAGRPAPQPPADRKPRTEPRSHAAVFARLLDQEENARLT